MNGAAILVAAFPALLIVGVLFAPLLAHRNRLRRSPGEPRYRDALRGYSKVNNQHSPPGITESEWAEGSPGDDPAVERDQYFADWEALQARFNEQPAEDSRASNDLIRVSS